MAEHFTKAQRAEFSLTGEGSTPAVIRVGQHETPVWIQQRWESGAFATYIRNNGCRHCCAAMAARLHGVKTDPYSEYVHCRRLWGAPSAKQGHWLTTAGIVKVLESFGVPAQGFGVAQFGTKKATERILSALAAGKQVIFTSTPDRYPENPFSKGYHWVMAVSVLENGTVLVANSSEKAAAEGIQFVTPDMIEKALFEDAAAPEDMTWGEPDRIHEGSGFIIV